MGAILDTKPAVLAAGDVKGNQLDSAAQNFGTELCTSLAHGKVTEIGRFDSQ